VLEAQLTSEAIRAAERLGRKRGQVVDVIGLSRVEQWLEQRVGEDGVVKDLLQSVQRLFATRVLE
jgi:hypothetical protein